MMKKTIAMLLLALIGVGAVAQENDGLVYPNTFYASVNAGAFAYMHSGATGFSAPSAGLSAGVWLTAPLAFQLSVDGVLGPAASSDNALFLMAGAEFKWDANATFFHVYNRNFLSPIPFYPMLGLGVAQVGDMGGDGGTDHAFQMMLGLQAPVRVAAHLDAVLQYKCFFLPQGFDGSRGDNYLHTLGLGLMYRQASDPYHRRTERYTRGVAEDWFFGLGIGPNYALFDLFSNPNLGGWGMMGVTPELMVGRNFSNFWSVRVVLNGLTAHEQYDTLLAEPGKAYRYGFLHADLMLNLSSLFVRERGVHLGVMPYLGAGPVWRFDDPQLDFAANVGLNLRYYLTRHSDLYLDFRYAMVPPSLAGGTGPSGHYFGVALPSLTVGYLYNFGNYSTRYRQPLNDCPLGI